MAASGQPFVEAVQSLLGVSMQVTKRHALHTFAVIPDSRAVVCLVGKVSKIMEEH
jgi:hypothetical protein